MAQKITWSKLEILSKQYFAVQITYRHPKFKGNVAQALVVRILAQNLGSMVNLLYFRS